MRNSLILALAGLVVACALPNQPIGRIAPLVTDSPHHEFLQIDGPNRAVPGSEHGQYFLRSEVQKSSGSVATALYVSDIYKGPWRVWTRATGPAGALDLQHIKAQVVFCQDLCYRREDFVIPLSDSLLLANRGGLELYIYDAAGTALPLMLDAGQIGAQIAAIASARP